MFIQDIPYNATSSLLLWNTIPIIVKSRSRLVPYLYTAFVVIYPINTIKLRIVTPLPTSTFWHISCFVLPIYLLLKLYFNLFPPKKYFLFSIIRVVIEGVLETICRQTYGRVVIRVFFVFSFSLLHANINDIQEMILKGQLRPLEGLILCCCQLVKKIFFFCKERTYSSIRISL